MRKILPALIAPLALAACSGQPDQTEAQAETLENAADQSTPEAAAELQNQADAMRDNGAVGAPGEPGSTTQQAIEQAGQAQTGATADAPAPPGNGN